MESLIGGPLNAAAKANSAMALTQTMFMLRIMALNRFRIANRIIYMKNQLNTYIRIHCI